MSSNTIGGSQLPNTGLGTLRDQLVRQRVTTPLTPAAIAPAAKANRPTTALAPETTLPAEPPAGTDPELWSVLSATERSFFAKVGSMGPLTYGKVLSDNARATAPSLRGGRLDIRG